jgi:hypothetical protein
MSAPLSFDAIHARFRKDDDGELIGTQHEWNALALVKKKKAFHSCDNQQEFNLVREHLRSWNYLVMDTEAFTSKLIVALNWPVMDLHAKQKDL